MVSHFDGIDESVSCFICGGMWSHSEFGMCSGRTDLVHGNDVSAHSLDGCATFDETGTCDHLAAIAVDCDCDYCSN